MHLEIASEPYLPCAQGCLRSFFQWSLDPEDPATADIMAAAGFHLNNGEISCDSCSLHLNQTEISRGEETLGESLWQTHITRSFSCSFAENRLEAVRYTAQPAINGKARTEAHIVEQDQARQREGQGQAGISRQ